jgi:hypothetical protein
MDLIDLYAPREERVNEGHRGDDALPETQKETGRVPFSRGVPGSAKASQDLKMEESRQHRPVFFTY